MMSQTTRLRPALLIPALLSTSMLLPTALVSGGCASGSGGDSRLSGRNGAPPELPAPKTPVERSSFREEVISMLRDAALSKDPLLRANAIEALQPTPSRAEPVARRGLTDENVGVRFSAAMTIGELRLKESAPHVRPLLSDPSPMVRAAAIFSLHRLDEQVDLTPLGTMLRSAPDPRQRAQAAFILGELGNRSAIPMLRDAADVDMPRAPLVQVRILRMQIAEALVKLGDGDAISTIRAALYPSRPEDLEVTALAVQIIGEVDDRRSIDQLIYLTAMEAESRMPAEIRLAAASALAKLGDRNGWFIADEYADSDAAPLRAQAAHVYGETGQPENLGKIRALMEDESGMVRVSAAAAALKILERGGGSGMAMEGR